MKGSALKAGMTAVIRGERDMAVLGRSVVGSIYLYSAVQLRIVWRVSARRTEAGESLRTFGVQEIQPREL